MQTDPRVSVYVLEAFHRQPEVTAARQLFEELVSLRADAYGADYGVDYVPYGASDFVARHYLFCEQAPSGVRALAGTSHVSLATCRRHGLPIPALELIRAGGAKDVEAGVEQMIECQPAALVYGGRYCMRASARQGPVVQILRDLFVAAVHADLIEHGGRFVATPIAGKTTSLCERIGFRRLPLRPFRTPYLGELVVMEMTEMTPWAIDRAARARPYLESAIRIGGGS